MKRVLLALVPILLTTGCPTAPEAPRPEVADESTFLGLAVVEASELVDALARAELYTRIARGYRELGEERSMLAVATAALRLVRGVGVTPESVRTRLELAPLLAAAGDDASALAVLEGGLEFAAASQDSQLKATMLPMVVRFALQSDEPARPLVRRAIDEVYVIENPRQRANALIRIAELYQAGGAFLSVTGLIQQAIPAVRSTDAPLRRGDLFAQLARLASATQEARLRDRLEQNVISEVEAAGTPATDEDSELLLSIIDQLAALGRIDEARRFIDRSPEPYFVARALIVVAAHTDAPQERLARLGAAAELADRIDDPQQRADAWIRLGVAHARADRPDAAVGHAEAASEVLTGEPTLYSRIDPPARLVSLLVMLDRLQAVRDVLLFAPDDYVQGAVAVRAAEQLIADGRLGLADDFLTLALVASDEATYLADGLRGQIVAGFARTGSIRLAIRTIERMEDELLRARAVVELAVVAEPAGLVTPIYRADLASVLDSR